MSEQRDRWSDGRIRHLRVDELAPPGFAYALREVDDEFYTLVVHPRHEARVDELRASPAISRFSGIAP